MEPQSKEYDDCYIPLESSPDVFNPLAQALGLSPLLTFQDVWALDETFIAGLPRPVHALLLVLPGGDAYEQKREQRAHECLSPDFEKVRWFRQTIHNACGLYGLLHAVCNGEAGRQIREYKFPTYSNENNSSDSFQVPGSLLANVLSEYPKAPASEQGKILCHPQIKKLYEAAALDGASEVPALGAEVDCHYTCFVKSNGHLYELDGDLTGPVDLGELRDEDDLLSEAALAPIRKFIESKSRDSIACNIMALAPAAGD
ncbi:MAG: hypothetical protein LQ346_003113 [Caloplaca aetnensis]|nr:MAG: hypothetical protein LQ346_003113 [Caloplaca aetnensis]